MFTILLLLSHLEQSKIIHCGLYHLFPLAHESKEVQLSQTNGKNECRCMSMINLNNKLLSVQKCILMLDMKRHNV